jgi:hypothetical protein
MVGPAALIKCRRGVMSFARLAPSRVRTAPSFIQTGPQTHHGNAHTIDRSEGPP